MSEARIKELEERLANRDRLFSQLEVRVLDLVAKLEMVKFTAEAAKAQIEYHMKQRRH